MTVGIIKAMARYLMGWNGIDWSGIE